MESLVRYFAVALARRGITVTHSALASSSVAANLVDGGVLVGLPPEVQQAIKSMSVGPRGELGLQDVSFQRCLICRLRI